MSTESTKEVIVVGGPNGAGKTTFVTQFLSELPYPYLSADAIAARINPTRPESVQTQAGREFLAQLADCIEREVSFIIESTLSGRSLLQSLRKLSDKGFRISIAFIFLDSPDVHVQRVHERVRRGGHNVPELDIRRRYLRSKQNFWNLYKEVASQWSLFYNSQEGFTNVALGVGEQCDVVDPQLFSLFQHGIHVNDSSDL